MAFQIIVAEESSFCPGVGRAFRITEKALFGKHGPVYSCGPLIHNPEVVDRLQALGLEVIEPREQDLPPLEGMPVIIRSHGIDIETEEELRARGALLVDATCPTVKRAQEEAAGLTAEGYTVLVIGSATHPEVTSIVGRAGGPVTVIETVEDAEGWIEGPGREAARVGVLCQTTISEGLMNSVVSLLRSRLPEVEVRNTLCESVVRRQREAVSLSKRVDVVLVVGGRNSSNTAHLARICSDAGVPTHQVEEPTEIRAEWLAGVGSVGVVGGASTPSWLIDEAVDRLVELGGTR